MCNFLSLVSNGDGKALYFDAKLRKQVRDKKISFEPDSHTSIADHFGYKGVKEDTLNKYEYNPLTKVFTVDQKNNYTDDSKEIESFCNSLDFKKVVPELIIKPIINPFKDIKTTKVMPRDLKLLKEWASVLNSVLDSVLDSVKALVGASVLNSVLDSVLDSVWDSVKALVGASVLDSIYCYYGSFFDIKYKCNITPCIKLWERGLVPSFDGKLWRLHGEDGKILWTGDVEALKAEGWKK